MNLRKRTILLLGITLFGSWVVLYLLSSASLLNSFASLERSPLEAADVRALRAAPAGNFR
jgi:hypothetical protein